MPLDPKNVFMFPESYNQLRKELFEYWNNGVCRPPNLWNRVGYYMAFDMPAFIEEMNTALDGVLKVIPMTKDDEFRTDVICTAFLTELRKRRGELNP